MTPLYAIADSLKARGIKAIAGGLCSGSRRISRYVDWVWLVVDDLGEDYGAGVDALYFNEGFGTAIARGKPGSRPDSIETYPAHSYPIVKRLAPSAHDLSDTGAVRLDFNPARTEFIARGRLKTAAATPLCLCIPIRGMRTSSHCARL